MREFDRPEIEFFFNKNEFRKRKKKTKMRKIEKIEGRVKKKNPHRSDFLRVLRY